MDELKPLRETRTTVIDKTTEDISFDTLPVTNTEEKKETAKKILFNNSPEEIVSRQLSHVAASLSVLSNSKIEFEAAKTFFSDLPEQELKVEKFKEAEVENLSVEEVENQKEEEIEVEKETQSLNFLKTEEETQINEETNVSKRVKPKTGLKARLKVITFGFFAVLTCFIGWVIYNAVEIETLRAQMEAANKTYSVNIVNYINNISKADDLTSDSLFNLQQLSEAGIVPLEPSELKNNVEYSVKSNWFDRLCNWLSGIFK